MGESAQKSNSRVVNFCRNQKSNQSFGSCKACERAATEKLQWSYFVESRYSMSHSGALVSQVVCERGFYVLTHQTASASNSKKASLYYYGQKYRKSVKNLMNLSNVFFKLIYSCKQEQCVRTCFRVKLGKGESQLLGLRLEIPKIS